MSNLWKRPISYEKKAKFLQNILKLYDDYQNVTRDIKNFRSDNPNTKISKFKEQLQQLCDFSAKNMFEIIMSDSSRTDSEKEIDCKFFKEQQTTWKGKFAKVDINYTKKCAAKFQRSQRFVKQKVHDEKKPFQCLKCDEGFDQESELKCHREAVHEGKKTLEISSSSSTNSSTISNESDDLYVTNYFKVHVSEWENNEAFKEIKNFVKYLKVSNEPAERGIKLVIDFSNTLTKSNSQRANIIQVVQAHRRFHPKPRKSNFVNVESNIFTS